MITLFGYIGFLASALGFTIVAFVGLRRIGLI